MEKEMRKRTIVLGIGFIIIGIIFVGVQPLMRYVISPYLLNKQYQEAFKINDDTIKKNTEINEKDVFDFDSIEELSFNTGREIDLDKIMGEIMIPSVTVHLPILYGTTNENLSVGVGTMKKDQIMGQGNYALAAHNSRNSSLFFAPIRNMKNGDKIYITDKNIIYVYEMIGAEVVEPERLDVVDDQPGEKIITLVSCYSSDGSDRIIVTGKLVSEFKYDTVNLEEIKR
jgi:sortase A